MLAEFAEKQGIPYPLLSDVNSEVIRRYGILNDQVGPDVGPLYGIPYPGVYITDEEGIVVAKSFHDTYKKRDSPEILIDAALGRIELTGDEPQARGEDSEVRVTAAVRGGRGSVRQGILRHLVVRFEMDPGLHIYSEPVPAGMIPTRVSLEGPPGLVALEPILPPTESLRLETLDLELPVWSETVDLVVPFYPTGELASEVRPLDSDSVELTVHVEYQACDDEACLMPRKETLSIELPTDVVDVPALGIHQGHGQREGSFSAAPHMRRLVLRKLRRHPLGLLSYFWKVLRLEIAGRMRRKV